MDNYQLFNKKHINKWLITILCGVILFIVMSIFVLTEIQRSRKNDELALSITYSAFQSETVNLIYEDITLLKGYLTFIETEDITEEISTNYLDRLTGSNVNHYRSISIIEDTTIKWIYPRVGNEDAIGVDLATVSGQKERIALVKENRQAILDGPIDLVQGGKGYIARLPIVKVDGSYWGQMSIVLDADKITKEIKEIARQKGIRVHIESADNGAVIIEDTDILNRGYLTYQLNDKYFNWKVYVAPLVGWKSDWFRIIVILIMSIISSFALSYAIYYGLRTNENLKILASKDSLTGLYNRYFLEDYQALVLSQADRYKKTVGFVLIDLDHFKNINDTYGHKVGDEVLKVTSKILEEQTRSNEAAFRLGGDEFLVVFPDLKSVDELQMVESRIIKAFSEKFMLSGHDIQIIPSIGTSVYPRDGSGFDQVLHEADIKMYKNKESK